MDRVSLQPEREPRRRDSVSKAELYAALEALLPLAQAEAGGLYNALDLFPEDATRAEEAAAAVEHAEMLLSHRSSYIRRQVRASTQGREKADG